MPETTASLGAWLLVGPAVAVGFFVSGYLAFRWLPSRQPLVTSFIGAGLLLFFAVLTGDYFQIALTREYLLFALGGAGLVGWLWSRRNRPASPPPDASPEPRRQRSGWRAAWWLIPSAIMTISLLARWGLDPQSGYDTLFRWDYLARVMASQQSLAHYPPVTAADFSVYPWCDGIPPMISVMNLWIYVSTGSSAEILGGVRWLAEFGLTATLVWQISRRLWDARGAGTSLAVLATSALFLSSISMGQETGSTGVALLALAALLFDYRDKPCASTAGWIGLAGGFAALCRDYNLLYLPVALGLLAAARARRAHWWLAASTMVATAVPWYLRNVAITGNPIFPHAPGGWLPSNPAHLQVMRDIQEYWSLFAPQGNLVELLKSLGIGTGALFLAALPALKPDRFERLVLVTLIATTTSLWLASVSSTAGGWCYSLRVLGSALPLLAVAAGASAQQAKRRWAFAAATLCTLLAVDAARRSWFFVVSPTAPVVPYSWQLWSNWERFIRLDRNQPFWAILSTSAEGDGIVVDHPNFFVIGRRAGGNMVSMFSPQVAALWRNDPPLDLRALLQALRKQHIRFVVLSGSVPREMYFPKSAPGVEKFLSLKPTVSTRGLWIYDLALLEQAAPPP